MIGLAGRADAGARVTLTGGGPIQGQKIDEREFRRAVELFYELSGWDQRGRPTLGKLVELNIEWLQPEMP